MFSELVRREWRELRLLTLIFALLPFLLALLLLGFGQSYAALDANAAVARGLLNGVFLPLLFGVFVVSQMVAGDKDGGHLDTLLALPGSALRVWLAKYATGLVLILIYGLLCNGIFSQSFWALLHGAARDIPSFLFFGYVFAVVLAVYYALIFLVSCLSANALSSVILGGVAGALWGGLVFLADNADNYHFSNVKPIVKVLHGVTILLGPLVLTVVLVALSCGYFLQYHRHPRWRRLPFILLLGLPLLMVALYVGMLMVVNYPPRNAYTPRFTAAWLYDQSNRENYQELAQLTFEWSQVIEADTAESLIGSIDWDNAQAAPDSTVMQFVQATAPMRERLLEFTATRALTPALSPSMGYHRDFDAHYLESAHQLELLAAAEELRHGRRAAATARFMRLLAGTVRLADTGTPAAVWAANTCLAVDARLLPELFPLSGQGGNPRLAGQVLRHLAAFETAARSSTVRVIEVQSMNLDYFCRELQKSVFNGGVYPFGNAAKQCAYYEKMYAGMMARSYRPYYENPYTYWSKPEFTIADYCLRPWNVATEVDVNYDFGRGEQAVAIDLSRLMRIQIYLSLYRQATGKLPDSLEALWRHFAVAPLTSELTGTPFPYPGIVDGQCVLFTWAEKTLASMARSYLFADRQNESAERIVLQ